MGFDLNNYETVKSRKKRFYSDNPDGRIIVENQTTNIMEYALVKAMVFKNKEDQEKNLPWSTGFALEMRDTELSSAKNGQKYESVNYSSWQENSEESAIGRALDNAGYAGNDKCSREEIEKAQRMKEKNAQENETIRQVSLKIESCKSINELTEIGKVLKEQKFSEHALKTIADKFRQKKATFERKQEDFEDAFRKYKTMISTAKNAKVIEAVYSMIKQPECALLASEVEALLCECEQKIKTFKPEA